MRIFLEIKAAVWHSFIAGARGIVYFNHSFGGPNPSQHALRDAPYAAVRAVVRSTNLLITQLAPVLNAPFVDGFAAADVSVRIMTKLHEGKYFIFAGRKENRASTPALSLVGFDNGTATVIGENRTQFPFPMVASRIASQTAMQSTFMGSMVSELGRAT